MSLASPRTVVFAYSNVGVRCLAALLANNVNVVLVVTHENDPGENIWFDSVAELAALNAIPTITPSNPNTPEIIEQIKQCAPDWLFSFYYRKMLCDELITLPRQGAFNMHGSLLPRYRGKAPINWAVLHGEKQTGASLHRMVTKPDAGPLLDQQAVDILPNDTAHEVAQKVTLAAEQILMRSLPLLANQSLRETDLDLSQGNYFSGRRPEDGRIDWQASAWQIHNLIRAVAPPYPGAFFDVGDTRVTVLGSYYRDEAQDQNDNAQDKTVRIYWNAGRCWADCVDGKRICLTHIKVGNIELDEKGFHQHFGQFWHF